MSKNIIALYYMSTVNKRSKCQSITTAAGDITTPAISFSTPNNGIYLDIDGDLIFTQSGSRKMSIGGSFALYNDSNQKNISTHVLHPTIPAGAGQYDIAQLTFTADASLLVSITACTTTGKHIIATYYISNVSNVITTNMLFISSRSEVEVTTDTAVHFSITRGAEQTATVKIELTGTETHIGRCVIT